ncbi:MAG TPA: hypothetical protein VHV75_09895 [Solirubrobacteraceae bacterium]|jgi:predicted RNA-binding Zn-ribbon protein involved in translation (DUF1610 family)|nr:hypothetical protein [Solirubrobacteraceae bacterium]
MNRRDFKRLLTALGYQFDRNAKHEIWANATGQEVLMSQGLGEIKAYQVDQLRKRHPDHPALKRKPGAGKGVHHGRDRHRQRALKIVPAAPSEKPVVLATPDRTSCVDCGRPWLSDISPVGRPCPKCGGEVVVGRRESRDFRFEVAA